MNSFQALEYFDSLPPVPQAEMIGLWAGSGFETGHPMDGLLEAYCWYGKRFFDDETVQPLLHKSNDGKIFAVNPSYLPISIIDKPWLPRSEWMKRIFLDLRFLVATDKSHARLRMVEYRGKSSAAMVYDTLPIIDMFRRIDENKLLGVMDMKGMESPFFFVLEKQELKKT